MIFCVKATLCNDLLKVMLHCIRIAHVTIPSASIDCKASTPWQKTPRIVVNSIIHQFLANPQQWVFQNFRTINAQSGVGPALAATFQNLCSMESQRPPLCIWGTSVEPLVDKLTYCGKMPLVPCFYMSRGHYYHMTFSSTILILYASTCCRANVTEKQTLAWQQFMV